MRVVIVGAGEVGLHVASRLAEENKEVVLIDLNREVLSHVEERLDVLTIEGSGSSPKILEEAGIVGASFLIAATDKDETNFMACFFTGMLSPKTRKVIRLRDEEYSSYIKAAELLDIDMVVNPDDEVVRSILRIVGAPGALEMSEFVDGQINFVGITLNNDCPLAGQRLSRLPELIKDTRILVAALVRNEELIIPRGTDRMMTGDEVYFVCISRDLEKALSFFRSKSTEANKVFIFGGGKIGQKLAMALDGGGHYVKIVERNPERASFLASVLKHTLVICGDITDHDLFEEEMVGEADLIVAVTGDEETNILATIMAKRFGAKSGVVRINNPGYIPLVGRLGIEHFISPRIAAVNSITRHLREGKIFSMVSIKGDDAEILEAEAVADSGIVAAPLKDLSFPEGVLMLCLIRGRKVIVPDGSTTVEPKDRVIILSLRKQVPMVEEMLAPPELEESAQEK